MVTGHLLEGECQPLRLALKRLRSRTPIRQALSEAFAGCPVDYYYEVHPGVEHGYALPDRDIHDKRAANRDWELIFAMFRRQLSA
jgi:dienelactone hydrolase